MKPIIMSTEDVRALLDGRKTMFRLVAKDITPPSEVFQIDIESGTYGINEKRADGTQICTAERELPHKPGDVLYVRETWTRLIDSNGDLEYFYRADMENPTGHYKTTWRSPVTMPREAARMFLRVKDVRVERAREITVDDCIKEGIDTDSAGCWDNGWSPTFNDPDSGGEPNFINGFMAYWNARNAKRGYGWDSNPWVWVYTFERITKEEAEHGY